MKKNKGITLIALIITIIVMLILVVVTLEITLGKNGIIPKAREAKAAQISNQEIEMIENVRQGYVIEREAGNLEPDETFSSYMCSDENKITGATTKPVEGKTDTVTVKFEASGNEYTVSENGEISLNQKNSGENEEPNEPVKKYRLTFKDCEQINGSDLPLESFRCDFIDRLPDEGELDYDIQDFRIEYYYDSKQLWVSFAGSCYGPEHPAYVEGIYDHSRMLSWYYDFTSEGYGRKFGCIRVVRVR